MPIEGLLCALHDTMSFGEGTEYRVRGSRPSTCFAPRQISTPQLTQEHCVYSTQLWGVGGYCP